MTAPYLCMTDEELRLWREAANAYVPATSPCVDCSWEYHREQVRLGLCDRRPSHRGTPNVSSTESHRESQRLYARRRRSA